MPAGRPTDYCPDLVAIICAALADGKSLRTICRDESMPSMVSVFKWLQKYPEFVKQYTQARESQADAMVDDILEIADDGTNDWMERRNKEGAIIGWELNAEHVNRSRLRVDARKWIASKLLPKKYGEKVETTHKGDPTAPVSLELKGSDVDG